MLPANAKNAAIAVDYPIDELLNEKRTVEFYQQAAAQGAFEAQYNLACCYQFGRGVAADPQQAVELYQLAAEQGLKEGISNAARCHQHLLQAKEESSRRAAELQQLVTSEGSVSARYELGLCYQEGQGVEQDMGRALGLFQLAANDGFADAQYHLGVCYQAGTGVEKSDAKAQSYLASAIHQNFAQAQAFWDAHYPGISVPAAKPLARPPEKKKDESFSNLLAKALKDYSFLPAPRNQPPPPASKNPDQDPLKPDF